METRKVQRAGYSSLSVSLPMNWTKKVSLKPGDMIFFTQDKENSLNLMISTKMMDEA